MGHLCHPLAEAENTEGRPVGKGQEWGADWMNPRCRISEGRNHESIPHHLPRNGWGTRPQEASANPSATPCRETDGAPSTVWRIQAAVLVFGACVHAMAIAAVPLILVPDSVWYAQLGAGIADQLDFSNELFLQRPVGYPALLAVIFALCGAKSPIALLILQHAMVLATAWLAMGIALELTRARWVMALTGLGVVCSLQLVGYAQAVLTEVPYTLLIVLLLWLTVRFHARGYWRLLAIASAVAGLATLVRPTGQYMAAICLLAALHRCLIERDRAGSRLIRWVRATGLAVVPCLAVTMLAVLFNGLVLGEFRSLSRTGASLFYRTRVEDQLNSSTNEALGRIDFALDQYEASRPPGSSPPTRYMSYFVTDACRAVYGMTPSEADQLMVDASVGLILEHPGVFARKSAASAVRMPFLVDDIHRFVPGGCVTDGWHAPSHEMFIGTNAYYRSTARLDVGDIHDRYLPTVHEPRWATRMWRSLVGLHYRYVEHGRSLTRLTDSLHEDYVLLVMVGGLLLLVQRRPSTSAILIGAVVLHVLIAVLVATCARYMAPIQPVLKLFVAVAVVRGVWAIGWTWRGIDNLLIRGVRSRRTA
jgi:hypothetical protein